jgi:predicted Zn-dependent peptidase
MFRKADLDNEIPVVMKPLKNVHSVCLGIWVKVGSRYESPEKNGVSHFLEHMFFKATKKRSAKKIAIDSDSIGSDLNAFTSREQTTFYLKVIDEYLEEGVDLVSDIFVNSLFPPEEIEKEKKVVIEEIKMLEDTPEDYIFDLFNRTVWGYKSLGQSILGRRESVNSLSRNDLMSHVRKYYGIKDIVIACAGNFRPERLMELLNRNFSGLRRGSEPKLVTPPAFAHKVSIFQKDLLEAHICIGVPSLSQKNSDRYVLSVLNTILGGGFSSRLFQDIRENRGLAYSIYSFTSMYLDTGLWGVYAGVNKNNVREAISLIMNNMLDLKETVTETELDRAKKHLKGNLLLALESTSSHMTNIARQEIFFGRYISSAEIMKSIDAVSLEQARELAEKLIRKDLFSITLYGDLPNTILDEVF